jgi:hypothetical protein
MEHFGGGGGQKGIDMQKSHFAYDLVFVRKFQLCLLPI